MNHPVTTVQLPDPSGSPASPRRAASGALIPALDQLRVFSSGQWEDFVLEWAHSSLTGRFKRVERCGGAGDLGRDVVAFSTDAADSPWTNFQCKHYGAPLQPAQILIELGKLCYYAHSGAYTVPVAYFFVAPQGAGNELSRLLRNPQELRDRLIKDWETKCASKITQTKKIPLEGPLLAYVQAFDFSIVDSVPPMDLLEQHGRTRWHTARFGGGLPTRATPIVPPLDDEEYESTYIAHLLDAYSEHAGVQLNAAMLDEHDELKRHLLRSRERFFHAEALRNFSRDNLPPGQFEALQDDFYDGVIDTVEDSSHPDGYHRVKKTTAMAQRLDPTNNALREVLGMRDKAGICHQLADNDRIKWVPE